ncbi:MAG: DNA-protecting protein DprA [Marmoricola sp.]|nr:DNA-protecting protein DprA [Marmoricola sp.]
MSADEQDRLARVTLSRVGEPGQPKLGSMLREHGAVRLLELLRSPAQQTARPTALAADLEARLAGVDPERELARAAEAGLRFVVPGDAEWPDALDDLAHAPPLHERGDVPVGLWCRGPLRLDEACRQAVAVVGSRSATSYGGQVAGDIAATLAREQWTTVSGAAFGIDHDAHRGALARRGPTVGVLACGVDRAYPRGNQPLIDYIAEVGLLVSEAAPGCAPTRIRFLARNRLIAALSRGTVVVEAAVRSGALNTASWASGLGRVLMGVPGPVTSAPSAGVHQLLRARDAVLVTSGEEVLEAVGSIGQYTLDVPREPEGDRDLLRPREQQVLDAVPKHVGAETESVARTAGVAPGVARTALATLARAGLVEHSRGRWRLAPPG